MALMSSTNVLLYTDKVGCAYLRFLAAQGTKAGSAASGGNVRADMNRLLNQVMGLNDPNQLTDMLTSAIAALTAGTAESTGGMLSPLVGALETHLSNQGKAVDSSIVGIATWAAYFNGGGGGAAYSNLLTPQYAQVWSGVSGKQALPAAAVLSPAIQPDYTATANANAMGAKPIGGVFAAGEAVNTGSYSAVNLVAEVIVNVAGGSGALSVQVQGIDQAGASTTTWGAPGGTPQVVTGGNNPAANLTGLTITPSITQDTRASVACTSTTGIVAGSILTINQGKADQEVILVESVQDASHFTAVFRTAHTAGATISGWTSTALTPSVSGRRCVQVTGITYGTNGHSLGTLRIAGIQDRAAL
jgi:hypothetical protein